MVAAAPQDIPNQRSYPGVVFHHEDGFRSPLAMRPVFGQDRLLRFRRRRQIDDELRSATYFALDDDVAAALLHDAVHRRQAKAGAAMTILCREERLEKAHADLG